ncbi:hypothetical protein Tco_0373999 [Tanacetum coccineum]
MRAEYNILENRKWRSLAEEKDSLLGAKDKEIEELKSQLLKAKEGLASAKEHIGLLEQECGSLKLKATEPQSNMQKRDRELSDLDSPHPKDDFNSAVSDLRGLNFLLIQEISNNKDASTWDIMDLLRLDDAVAEALGMTDLQKA